MLSHLIQGMVANLVRKREVFKKKGGFLLSGTILADLASRYLSAIDMIDMWRNELMGFINFILNEEK